jgi:DNA-directed RNA polymerase subunit RPC12/RpoP
MKNNNEIDERVQRYLNPNCVAVLFVSRKVEHGGTELRNVNRGGIHIRHDKKGDYIECSKCGAKHIVGSKRGQASQVHKIKKNNVNF